MSSLRFFVRITEISSAKGAEKLRRLSDLGNRPRLAASRPSCRWNPWRGSFYNSARDVRVPGRLSAPPDLRTGISASVAPRPHGRRRDLQRTAPGTNEDHRSLRSRTRRRCLTAVELLRDAIGSERMRPDTTALLHPCFMPCHARVQLRSEVAKDVGNGVLPMKETHLRVIDRAVRNQYRPSY
jgi:hypothetical protein